MPVVGTPEKVNDTFVEQITMNAEAAIAKAAEMGVIDPARVAIGGDHSRGFLSYEPLSPTHLFQRRGSRHRALKPPLTPFSLPAHRPPPSPAQPPYISL